jgi:hypothetical protein
MELSLGSVLLLLFGKSSLLLPPSGCFLTSSQMRKLRPGERPQGPKKPAVPCTGHTKGQSVGAMPTTGPASHPALGQGGDFPGVTFS